MRYSPGYGDLAKGASATAPWSTKRPSADAEFRAGALAADNLTGRGTEKAVRRARHGRRQTWRSDAADAEQLCLPRRRTGLQVPSSATGGRLVVSFSDNNGLDWKQVAKVEKTGEQRVDLKSLVFRRYDYRLSSR